MVTEELLEERRALIQNSADLRDLAETLTRRAEPVLARMPPIPSVKALLSREGGFCPHDGASLVFDPWSPEEHRCPVCHQVATGERQHRHWAKLQHLWLAERAAHLAALGSLTGNEAAARRAGEILEAYHPLYLELPNRDNVLGPSHLFFSTYLESIWLLNYLAAASLLRESGWMDEDLNQAVNTVVDEAANIIGDFNEGFSNRQTWHAAALTAIAGWFGDEDLALTAIEGRTGLLGHLADGFGDDGTWYEGENYHLFAMRGLLLGLGWAQSLGADLLEDPAVAEHLRRVLLAPALTALPDYTFPARKDSRFGVSLGQPMYLESWEAGRGLLKGSDDAIAAWLTGLYQIPAQPALALESYLHEAGEPAPGTRGRRDLSWWSLLLMTPELSGPTSWQPSSQLFHSQGLAVLRQGDRYLSLECGGTGGGHGHPDRLHLTLHARGIHWLPDFGTGSYVSKDLFWYRSSLAHNAPLLDGESQPRADATCVMFDAQKDWGWTRARFMDCERTVVAGPDYVVDVVTFSGDSPRRMDLPWHLMGEVSVSSPGRWESVPAGTVESEFVHDAQRFVRESDGAVVLQSVSGGKRCLIHLRFEGELIQARAPGPPGTAKSAFFVGRGQGSQVRMVAVIDLSGAVKDLTVEGDVITVSHAGTDRHTPLLEGWQVEGEDLLVRLAGPQRSRPTPQPILTRAREDRVTAHAPWVDTPPALNGSSDGFDQSEPIVLDTELQYRRSELPYEGPEAFSATAWINWSDEELFLMVEVTKPDVWFRPGSATPLELDNEADDIHSDGFQVYLTQGDHKFGFLIVPEEDAGLRISPAGGWDSSPDLVTGQWVRTAEGYRVTLGVKADLNPRDPVGFDLLINEMRPDRQRRAGQLVWTGGNGWVYLRGDRHDPAQLGLLVLSG